MFKRATLAALTAAVLLATGCKAPNDETGDDSKTTLPQVLGGALWANPDLYSEIPLKIEASAGSQIEVDFDGDVINATEDDGAYVANLPIADVADGAYTLTIFVDGEAFSETPVLNIGRAGHQFTDWDVVGPALTPRVHVAGDALYLTWVDLQDGIGKLWLQELNGAGRPWATGSL